MVLKLVAFFFSLKGTTALFNDTRRMCKINGTNKVRDRLLNNFKFYKFCAFFVVLAVVCFIAYPSKAFIVDHQHVPLLPIEFMFVDQSTLSGFLIANFIMSILGLFANAGTTLTVLLIAVIVTNYSIMVDLFEEDVKSLDEMWTGTSTTTVRHRHFFLRNICRKQQDLDAYSLSNFSEFFWFYLKIFFLVTSKK